VRRRLVLAGLVFLVPLAALVFVLRPICVPLTAEDLKTFNVPIEQRTDRDFYLKVFQRRDGQWYQCKTWISRFFFL
jgi:hypothetical protein